MANATALPTTHQPMLSAALSLNPATPEVPPLAVVPLGKVPLIKMVSVPLTEATLTNVEFRADVLPLPIKLCM